MKQQRTRQSHTFKIHRTNVYATRGMVATAMRSESDMDAARVSKEAKLGIPSLVPIASNDIYHFGRWRASVGIVGRREGHVD